MRRFFIGLCLIFGSVVPIVSQTASVVTAPTLEAMTTGLIGSVQEGVAGTMKNIAQSIAILDQAKAQYDLLKGIDINDFNSILNAYYKQGDLLNGYAELWDNQEALRKEGVLNPALNIFPATSETTETDDYSISNKTEGAAQREWLSNLSTSWQMSSAAIQKTAALGSNIARRTKNYLNNIGKQGNEMGSLLTYMSDGLATLNATLADTYAANQAWLDYNRSERERQFYTGASIVSSALNYMYTVPVFFSDVISDDDLIAKLTNTEVIDKQAKNAKETVELQKNSDRIHPSIPYVPNRQDVESPIGLQGVPGVK